MSLAVFKLIPGKFVIVGYQPDGDSVRFIASSPSAFKELYRGHLVKPSKKDKSIQLRFDCVDAPEVHYGGSAQPLGTEARKKLLDEMGFEGVMFGPGDKEVTKATVAAVPGAILTNSADPHGRPISYVVVGEKIEDLKRKGDYPNVDDKILDMTLNKWLLEKGVAYCLLYTSAPEPHRDYFRSVAENAQKASLGVWERDSSEAFTLEDPADIGPDGALIYPKLFRRATDYLKDRTANGFSGNLAEWIASTPRQENDEVLLPGDVQVHLSELIKQRNKTVSLQGNTLDMIFVER